MTDLRQALFVAWQSRKSLRFHPVARLALLNGENSQTMFEFAYIQAALEADDFQPFLAFPDKNQVYRSSELFPMFANRLMSKNRADFPEYLGQLGLPPATTSPMVILARSAGRRVTDTLELFPLPEFEPGYGYRTWFWAHGMRHVPATALDRISQLVQNEQLYPMCDVQNPVVSSAIALRTADGHLVGYMPSYLLDDAHTLTRSCETCVVYVERANSPTVPLHQRLLCRLESCWPDGFVPYSTTRYQPLSRDAAVLRSPVLDGTN